MGSAVMATIDKTGGWLELVPVEDTDVHVHTQQSVEAVLLTVPVFHIHLAIFPQGRYPSG